MDEFIEKVKLLRARVEFLYIYGAGLYGQTLFRTLDENNIRIDGFTTTVASKNNRVLNLPVFKAEEVIKKNTGLILGLNKFNTIEVLDFLKSKNFDMDCVLYRKEFVRNAASENDLNENPMMEVTTRIGCKVNCQYCPQSILLRNYYKNDKNRKTVLEPEDFKRCLDRLPNNCDIVFCGMSEPLLNPKCIDMMEIACDTGRTVELFTTLVGINSSDVDRICKLPLNLVTLHVADKAGNAEIPTSQEYYQMVEKIINAKKKDGSALVNVCSSQGEADERIKDICKQKVDIVTVMHDRAGNLQGDNLMKQEGLHGKIACSFCKQGLNRNILLPDGTVLLCCMDYGMKHPLGNLLEETYEEIMNGAEMKKIRQGINGDETIDILCRRCAQAHNVIF